MVSAPFPIKAVYFNFLPDQEVNFNGVIARASSVPVSVSACVAISITPGVVSEAEGAAAANEAHTIEVVPNVIFTAVCRHAVPALAVPSSATTIALTKLVPVAQSAARVAADADPLNTYIPFSAAAVWFFAKNRSLAAIVTPSMVVPGLDNVILAVEAARTLSFQPNPDETADSCSYVTASPDAVPCASPVILFTELKFSDVCTNVAIGPL